MNGALDGAPTAGGLELRSRPFGPPGESRGQVLEEPWWSRREEVGGSTTRDDVEREPVREAGAGSGNNDNLVRGLV